MADVKPTPTQAENDQVAMGTPVPMHEPDGSPEEQPQAQAMPAKAKQATAAGTTGYQTRQSKPAESKPA
jgi:hypothetical protein